MGVGADRGGQIIFSQTHAIISLRREWAGEKCTCKHTNAFDLWIVLHWRSPSAYNKEIWNKTFAPDSIFVVCRWIAFIFYESYFKWNGKSCIVARTTCFFFFFFRRRAAVVSTRLNCTLFICTYARCILSIGVWLGVCRMHVHVQYQYHTTNLCTYFDRH